MFDHIAIDASALRKSYGDHAVLDGIDLKVPRGSVFALLGPNGAGKTTTVRILSTLVAPDGGRALVAGHDVVAERREVRHRISLTGQYAAVDELQTGRENLEMIARLLQFPGRQAKPRAVELLERFDLADAADRRVSTYSGGMRRRLDLGASLVGAPRLLLLDEPTTGLDPRSRIELWGAIRALVNAGTDVLLTTQYLDEADHLASQIVIIDHGRSVATGSPAELKRDIGGSIVELHVRNERDLVRVAELLGRLDDGETQIDEATRRVSVRVHSGGEALMSALQLLQDSGVELADIGARQPNLDEVFLSLTGRPTEDSGSMAARAA
jgi:ABC-2 type transport system ATP-binding protein